MPHDSDKKTLQQLLEEELEGVEIPDPVAIRKDLLVDSAQCARFGPLMVVYDSESQAGGMINLLEKPCKWMIYLPVSPTWFAQQVQKLASETIEAFGGAGGARKH